MKASVSASFYIPEDEGLLGIGLLEDLNFYIRAFYQSGKRYTPYILAGYDPVNGRPLYEKDRDNLYGEVGADWFYIDVNIERHVKIAGMDFGIQIEVTNILDNNNAAIINPVTGEAYEYGDPTPGGYNDPLYPDLQAPLNPYPYNPARYLAPRNIRAGISVKL